MALIDNSLNYRGQNNHYTTVQYTILYTKKSSTLFCSRFLTVPRSMGWVTILWQSGSRSLSASTGAATYIQFLYIFLRFFWYFSSFFSSPLFSFFLCILIQFLSQTAFYFLFFFNKDKEAQHSIKLVLNNLHSTQISQFICTFDLFFFG